MNATHITAAVAMSNKFRLPKRNMELIAQHFGRDLMPFISSEDRIRDLTPEQRLQGLDAEQRLQGLPLEDRIEDLSDEERRALRKLLDEQESGT